jgi:hypothetical protein
MVMADNVPVEDISNYTGGAYTSAINLNFEKLSTAFDEVIWKDGREAVTGDIDLNGNRILNLPTPLSDLEPVRKIDIASLVPVDAETANEILAQAQSASLSAQNSAAAAALSAETVDYTDIEENKIASQEAAELAQSAAIASQSTVDNLLNGSQTFSGDIKRDTQFFLGLSSSQPYLNFDAGDYIYYNRTANTLSFVIGTSSIYDLTGGGLSKAGQGSVINHYDPTMQSGRIIVKAAAAPDPVTYQKGDLIATI